jgi:hypothetical protein
MLFLACVNYEQDRDAAGATDRMPALLFVNRAIPVRDDVRIFEESAPPSQMKRHVSGG